MPRIPIPSNMTLVAWTEKASCGTCGFLSPRFGQRGGNCHRFPPQVSRTHESPMVGFPRVMDDDYCGEYVKNKDDG